MSKTKEIEPEKKEFIYRICDVALENTNKELVELNLLDLGALINQRDHYSNELQFELLEKEFQELIKNEKKGAL